MLSRFLSAGVLAIAAVGAAFAPSAQAVTVNPEGVGQVLLYPYYTTTRHQQTLLTVSNTGSTAKVARVRFLEGRNGRAVLNFNVFLGPNDSWVAAVFAPGDAGLSGGGAALVTTDHSCTSLGTPSGTLPDGRGYYAFESVGYQSTPDTGPTDLARETEGHVELLAMADLTAGSPTSTAITPVDGTPPNCAPATADLTGNADLVPPTTGLIGGGGVIQVARGTYFTYNATAIDGFTRTALYYPDTPAHANQPSLNDANTVGTVITVNLNIDGQGIVAASYDRATDPYAGVNAVTAALTAASLQNQYTRSATLGSDTDWIITFPTKRYYVDPALVGTAGAPFPFVYGQDAPPRNGAGQSCIRAAADFYDFEGGNPIEDGGFSPPPVPPTVDLCQEVNALSFGPAPAIGSASAVFGSALSAFLNPPFSDGWARLRFYGPAVPDAYHPTPPSDGFVLTGLPVIGFQALNYVNGQVAAGVLANYGGLFGHRYVRQCNYGGGICPGYP